MKNKLIVKEAYHIEQNNTKLLVFDGYDKHKLNKNDILSDGINDYKIMGFTPNLIQDILTISVEADDFVKNELIGKELSVKNLRQRLSRTYKRIQSKKFLPS